MEQTRKPRRVALFVGVDDYPKESGIWPLRGAVNDATALYDFIRDTNSFDKDGIALLRNPTTKEIRQKARELSGPLAAGDFFLFFFAGHGVTDNGVHHLLCTNSEYDHSEKLVSEAVTFRDILGKTGKEFGWALILDACRTNVDAADTAYRSVGGEQTFEARDISLCMDAFVEAAGADAFHSVIYSCDDGKTAGELIDGVGTNSSRGLFTYSLIETLRDYDTHHKPALFDQALIGRVEEKMLETARAKELKGEQHPYYKANRNSEKSIPYFIPASTNFSTYKKWLESTLWDGEFIDEDLCDDCKACLNGKHGKALQQAVLQVCRVFSSENLVRVDAASGRTAADLLKAICSSIDEIDSLRRKVEELNKSLTEAPPVKAEHEWFVCPSQPLQSEKVRELRAVADGVTVDWRDKESIRTGLAALRTAQTEREALDALRAVSDAVRDEFVRKNYHSLGEKRLERLPPLFSSKAWNDLMAKTSVSDASALGGALCSLFRLSTSCCRILKY